MVGDSEPVRLVPDPLQQVQALAGPGQDHRRVVAGQPDLLQPLGQPAGRDVIDAELVQGPRGRGDPAHRDARDARHDRDVAGRKGAVGERRASRGGGGQDHGRLRPHSERGGRRSHGDHRVQRAAAPDMHPPSGACAGR